MNSKFDSKSKASILSYAERLQGISLQASLVREGLPQTRPDGSSWALRSRNAGEGSKGGFGSAVQEGYFGLELDSRPEPDFVEAALELKTTGLKQLKNGKWVPKERLKITAINYHLLLEHTFEESLVAYKANDILIVFYFHEKGIDDPLLLHVDKVVNWGFGQAPPGVMAVIRDDYRILREKVEAGLAHEISGGDTQYLEALTSGAGHGQMRSQPCSELQAKPRSFALKQSLLREILRGGAIRLPAVANPVKEAIELLQQFHGRSAGNLAEQYAQDLSPTAKSFCSNVTNRLFGPELKAALKLGEIKVVNMRCRNDWGLNESVSFPAFSFADLFAEDDWYTSSCRQQMEQRMLFVIWRKGATLGESVLLGAFPWTIPQEDLEGHVKHCWEQARMAITASDGGLFPSSTENSVAHVRPHGRRGIDVDTFPNGSVFTKQCFWLNQGYLKTVVQKAVTQGDFKPWA